jgi:hypothetical protein
VILGPGENLQEPTIQYKSGSVFSNSKCVR